MVVGETEAVVTDTFPTSLRRSRNRSRSLSSRRWSRTRYRFSRRVWTPSSVQRRSVSASAPDPRPGYRGVGRGTHPLGM